MNLDLEKYQNDIDERLARIARARRFEEPDRVPVGFAIGGSYFCWLFGYDIAEYYATPELQVEVQEKGIEWEYEFLRADSCTRRTLAYDAGPIQEYVVCGGRLERPPATSPRLVHPFGSLDEVLAARFPRPEDNPRYQEELRRDERFAQAARQRGTEIPVQRRRAVAAHPPLSFLCAILDPAVVCTAMYTEPEKLKQALDRCYEAFLWYREIGVDDPRSVTALSLADDNISFIGPDAFREFEMPYYLDLRQRYRLDSFFLHTDGPNDQHFRILADEVKLTAMDIGGFSQLENAVREMKGKVFISGGLNCKDFYPEGGLPDATRIKALEALRRAGPGGGFQLAIGGECYVGVSPQAIRELVDLVREHGRYPIRA